MARLDITILFTKSHDAACDALKEVKRLNREGWIDVTCYALVDGDEKDGMRIYETSERAETIGLAAGEELRGALLEQLFPPAGSASVTLEPGGSALLVLADQGYADLVAEGLASHGPTVRRPIEGGQCEVALRASIEGLKNKIAWLEELIEHESDKAGWTSGGEKESLESAVRAGRTELGAEREQLQSRLMAFRAELEARLSDLARRAEKAGAGTVSALSRDIMEVERDIADINEDLAVCILDHLNGLSTHAAELRERSARASADAAALEDRLREIELHLRKYRAALTATLASSAWLARECSARLPGNANQEHKKKLEQRHALLKADIQRLQREEPRTWNDLASVFREARQVLRGPLDETMRESG